MTKQILASDIKWATYLNYEGPYFPGHIKYTGEANADFLGKVLQVICSTEGGNYSAINMYDRCVVTVGISQLCMAAGVLQQMLGACMGGSLAQGLNESFAKFPTAVKFLKTTSGKWSFFMADGVSEIATKGQMSAVFLGGASGLKGEWGAEAKATAKEVAAGFANLWNNEALCEIQRNWSKNALPRYLTAKTKATLYERADETGYAGALKAAVMSYSANLPAKTDKMLGAASANAAWAGASDVDRFTLAMKSFVLDSGIAIWPIRYRAIRPVIQTIWGVELPSVEDLGKPTVKVADSDPLSTNEQIQRFLIDLGYDLGPYGDDGVIGVKTSAAIAKFQADYGIFATVPPGLLTDETHQKMVEVFNRSPMVVV